VVVIISWASFLSPKLLAARPPCTDDSSWLVLGLQGNLQQTCSQAWCYPGFPSTNMQLLNWLQGREGDNWYHWFHVCGPSSNHLQNLSWTIWETSTLCPLTMNPISFKPMSLLSYVNLNRILYHLRLVCTLLCICPSSTYRIIQGLLTRKSETRDFFLGELWGNSWLRTLQSEPNIDGIFCQMTGLPDIWLNNGMFRMAISEHLLCSL
jgi:hypothetical protein